MKIYAKSLICLFLMVLIFSCKQENPNALFTEVSSGYSGIEFKNLDNRLHNRYSDAGYDWDTNRVTLRYTIYLNKESSDIDSAKEACSQITERLRSVWGDQYPYARNVASHFEHTGFTSKRKPENFSTAIQNATHIKIEAFGTQKTSPPYFPYSKLLICENRLMDTKLFMSEPTD